MQFFWPWAPCPCCSNMSGAVPPPPPSTCHRRMPRRHHRHRRHHGRATIGHRHPYARRRPLFEVRVRSGRLWTERRCASLKDKSKNGKPKRKRTQKIDGETHRDAHASTTKRDTTTHDRGGRRQTTFERIMALVHYYHRGDTRAAAAADDAARDDERTLARYSIAYARARAPVPRVSTDRGVTACGGGGGGGGDGRNARAVWPNSRRNTGRRWRLKLRHPPHSHPPPPRPDAEQKARRPTRPSRHGFERAQALGPGLRDTFVWCR